MFSNYYKYHHPKLYHGSTAINDDGDIDAPDAISLGDTSEASVSRTRTNNKAYWHRCNIDKDCGTSYNK